MDLDSFLVLPRWQILQIIANKPSSPLEIAEQTGTTISYVSQQLKLLEAKGLVKKRKTGAFQKGKPRNLFYISDEFVYFTVLADGFAGKKRIVLNNQNKILLKIWFLDDLIDKKTLEKFFLFIGDFLEKINFVFLDLSKKDLVLIIVSDNLSLKDSLNKVIKKLNLNLSFRLVSPSKFEVSNNFYLIYEQIHKFKTIELKGGGIR